jgi:hypothetical protein
MGGWGVALARRGVGVGRGRPVAGGSWPGGQPSPPSSQPIARRASVDRSEATMSKRTRTLVLGAVLAAMNLAGLTAVAQAQATNEGKDARGRPPKARSGRPGVSVRSRHGSRPPRTPPTGGSWPESAPPSPAGHPPRCPPQRLTNPAGHPAGSWLPSLSWPLPWCSPAGWPCWPPTEPAAGLGLGTRPDQESRSRRSMGLPRPPGSPIGLSIDD